MNSTNAAPGQAQLSRRDRIGVSLPHLDAASLVDLVAGAEQAGVTQVWLTQNPTSNDDLVVYAVALQRTQQIRVGTSIVPAYPRHPLALGQEAATAAAFGPGRLRLGVGSSHRNTIEGTYGLTMQDPLEYVKEYVDVLRAALWDGNIDFRGRFFTAKVKLNNVPKVPVLMAALGASAFRLAGQISDGAISWNCPVSYLQEVAMPALRDGASAAGRAAPPLVAHVWVALDMDRDSAREAARKVLSGYGRQPFYANMWAAAGYPVQPDAGVSDALIDNLVVSGDEQAVASRLDGYLNSGLDELLLTSVYPADAAEARTRLLQFVGAL